VKFTVACWAPAVAVPMVGAPGTIPLTLNAWVTCGAAENEALPAWLALMLQLPAVTKVSVPPVVIVHTEVVLELNVTVNPDVAVAVSVGVVPKFCGPGLAKVITCDACGVTLFDAADGAPVPVVLVALTVNVYAVPLVRPVTVQGVLPHVAVMPPGALVAVYCVIGLPPVKAGGVKLTDACPEPGVAVPIVGAPGTTAPTAKVWVTCGAASYTPLPL
jgi:uncharacterized protein (DUF983 family)